MNNFCLRYKPKTNKKFHSFIDYKRVDRNGNNNKQLSEFNWLVWIVAINGVEMLFRAAIMYIYLVSVTQEMREKISRDLQY